jgi:hypothetical protein
MLCCLPIHVEMSNFTPASNELKTVRSLDAA